MESHRCDRAERREYLPDIPPVRCDGALLHLLAAPRRHDDVRPSPQHFIVSNDSILRKPFVSQLGKNRLAASDFDQLFDPLDSGRSTGCPTLQKHPRPARKCARRVSNPVEPLLEGCCERSSFVLTAHDSREHADHLKDVRNGPLVEREHRKAAFDEL